MLAAGAKHGEPLAFKSQSIFVAAVARDSSITKRSRSTPIDNFTVVCLVARPLNENEAGDDLVLIETSLLFLCKFVLVSIRTASLT